LSKRKENFPILLSKKKKFLKIGGGRVLHPRHPPVTPPLTFYYFNIFDSLRCTRVKTEENTSGDFPWLVGKLSAIIKFDNVIQMINHFSTKLHQNNFHNLILLAL
jgi:hypothetical protein